LNIDLEMKIGFIFPNKDRRYKTIHLGLAYLASYAREQHDDLEFQVLDTRVATTKETKNFFATSFDLIGITVFSPVYFEVIDLFNRIKKADPKVPVCLGGPYVTTIREEIFKKTPADFAVYGEGEVTFSELLFYLKGKMELFSINGLIYKNGSGEIVINPPREKIKDLNNLPLPAYDIFPMHRYPLHRMVTSRGCPFACAWCNSSSLWDQTYRTSDPEKIVDEIEFLVKNYGKKIFVFGDNSFNADLKRVNAFCDLLLRKNINILWSVSLRADIMTPETARKMKKAGCYNVSIGIESANNEMLKKIGKGTTIEKMTEGIKMLKDAGIEIMSQYVIGSPDETLDMVKESIAFAKKSDCDYTNFYTVLPFKGTRQWEYVLEHGTLYTRDIHEFHSINPRIVFETPEFPYKDRLTAIKLVKKEGFYSNKDKKNWMFDFAKETSRKIQGLLPETMGERVYLVLKSIYRLKIVKKNNQ
jgi:anaerobic magnesium-protoporphyrin IX monomethyl ester cyclase